MKWIVHKFGGTSVANADRYRAVAKIVLARAPGERAAVVVSAMSGVTNGLIESVELAANRDTAYLTKLQDLKTRHLETIRSTRSSLHANRRTTGNHSFRLQRDRRGTKRSLDHETRFRAHHGIRLGPRRVVVGPVSTCLP